MSDLKLFKFKMFALNQSDSVFKIGTDAFVLGSWIGNLENCEQILDVGTGTGILSMMAAQHFPDAQILAIDNNYDAFELAAMNFSKSKLGEKCRAQNTDFLELEENQKFDLIVSNPPYFLDSISPEDLVLEQAKHLTSADLTRFFLKAARVLSENGKLCLIYPIDSRFEILAKNAGLFPQKILQVYGKPDLLKRQCVQFGFDQVATIFDELTIRTASGQYSEEYKLLTAAFHGVSL